MEEVPSEVARDIMLWWSDSLATTRGSYGGCSVDDPSIVKADTPESYNVPY